MTMAKKTTLKHMQPNGAIVTRQTARAYTCVLLRKHNVAALLAAHDAGHANAVKEATEYARTWFKRCQLELATKVGDPIPYTENQGGFKRFRDGTLATYPMHEWEPVSARKWLAQHGETEAAFVASIVAERLADRATRRATLAAYKEEWFVISWHGSARTAKSPYIEAGDQFMVEEINNGVRA
jgi:hypothetical protein